MYYVLGSLSEKKYGIFWEFFPYGGGGLTKSQNFCYPNHSPKNPLKHPKTP